MGFGYVLTVGNVPVLPMYGPTVCNGNESYLSDCDNETYSWATEYCLDYDSVGVICSGSEYAIPVRLSNGTSPSNGRVEIYANHMWGTICDYGWDIRDARVVCRQLGYPSKIL